MSRAQKSAPLRIDSLPAGAGRIGVVLWPGEKAGRRDLEADLAVLVGWRPTVLVSLLEPGELKALKGLRPEVRFEAEALEWRHLPLREHQPPDARFERAWIFGGAELRDLLSRGGRILLHCTGDGGRAAYLAARLLVEMGEDPETAWRKVRTVRPGRAENPNEARPVLAPEPPGEDPDRRSRRLACLAAGAVGDALGSTVAFLKASEIQRRYGDAGVRVPEFDAAGRIRVSDDTQMVLFAAQGLIRTGETSLEARTAAQRLALLDWLETQEGSFIPGRAGLLAHPSMWVRRGPGRTCLSALRAGGRGDLVRPINDSPGCGAVARSAPAGLLPDVTPQAAFEIGVRGAALTHGHPSGHLPAGALAALVAHLMTGRGLDESWAAARSLLALDAGARQTLELTDRAVDLAGRPRIPDVEGIRRLGAGRTGPEALAIALFAALRGEDLLDTLRIASNHDGNSGSTAAIAGNIRGAEEGLFGLPLAWILALDVIDPLAEIVNQWPAA